MSQENVELMRHMYEAFNRQDIDAYLDSLHPDVEVRENVLAPDVAVYHGHDGVREWANLGAEALKDVYFEPERFIDSGDSVIAVVRASGRGAGSDAPFSVRVVH